MTIRETRIGVFLNGNRAVLCYTVLLEIMLLFPMIMSPIFKRVFTDSILINNITGWLPVLLLLMTGAAFFSALAATAEGKPLALLPRGFSGYSVYDPQANRTGRLRPVLAASLAPLALAVFRPSRTRQCGPVTL
ncbi:MAG: hypothetical protein LBG14_02555 [Treponema sp.]|jgi:hypothetical protein|nr:hypothetical protein [Treponema sp.]